MCGINGIIRFKDIAVAENDLQGMMQTMKHRGPNDQGIYLDGNLGLGFVRLSIIELSTAGHQPFTSEDNRFVMVFNGEIFNYIELRDELKKEGVQFQTKTDTEVLLKSYIHWGEACQHKFNGMWAFAIYDKQNRTLFISRDRFGVKPLYYWLDEHCFIFSSEIPPILNCLKVKPKADYNSIYDYILFNKTDHTINTFFVGIKKLFHGHQLKISLSDNVKANAIVPTQWYDLTQRIRQSKGFNNALEFKEELKRAVRLRLRSDVPLGVCFSGGLDSSSIVSIIIDEFKVQNLHTFSSVFDDTFSGNEKPFIDLYKDKPGKRNFTTPTSESLLNDLDRFVLCHAEPLPSTGPYAQFKVMELAGKDVVVTIDGQGADEYLAGYHYFFGFYFKDLFKRFKLCRLMSEIYYYLKIHKSLFAIKTFVFFLLPKSLRTKVRISGLGYVNEDFINRYGHNQVISDNLYGSASLQEALINHFNYKLEHLLKWEDRNSMHFSIEARVPFLDYMLVEKALATASDLVIKDGMTKYILREAMSGLLDEKIRMRVDKNGFSTPQDNWFRTEQWQTKITEIITSASFSQRKIIDPKKALELYQRHLKNEINIAKEIWKWIHLELWFRKFID